MSPKQCQHCGWGGPPPMFWGRWCVDCATAYLMGGISAVVIGIIARVLELF